MHYPEIPKSCTYSKLNAKARSNLGRLANPCATGGSTAMFPTS